jgi:hypothetical protein
LFPFVLPLVLAAPPDPTTTVAEPPDSVKILIAAPPAPPPPEALVTVPSFIKPPLAPPPTTVTLHLVTPAGTLQVPDDENTAMFEKPPPGVPHDGAAAPLLCKNCPEVPAASIAVVPEADWYGTVPALPPAKFVEVPTATALKAVCPVPPLATGSVPVTPVAKLTAAGVAQVGAAVDPAETNTCPEVPKFGDAPTPTAPSVFSVTDGVVPLTWSCNVPSVLPVLLSAVVVVVPAAMIDMVLP